jgi:hypothetical protein
MPGQGVEFGKLSLRAFRATETGRATLVARHGSGLAYFINY